MNRLILYIIAFTFFISACNDHLKIDANNNSQGYADSQFVGSWKITAVSSTVPWDWDGNGSVESNIYSTWTVCQKDNLYTFVGDATKTGSFKLNCSTTADGNWRIINTQYLFYQPINLNPESEKVISMTSIQFITSLDIVLPSGQPASIIKTWTRQ